MKDCPERTEEDAAKYQKRKLEEEDNELGPRIGEMIDTTTSHQGNRNDELITFDTPHNNNNNNRNDENDDDGDNIEQEEEPIKPKKKKKRTSKK